jgi:hypothetical protein
MIIATGLPFAQHLSIFSSKFSTYVPISIPFKSNVLIFVFATCIDETCIDDSERVFILIVIHAWHQVGGEYEVDEHFHNGFSGSRSEAWPLHLGQQHHFDSFLKGDVILGKMQMMILSNKLFQTHPEQLLLQIVIPHTGEFITNKSEGQ